MSLNKPIPDGEVPSPWVVRFLPLVRPDGTLLDLAAGGRRHSRLAASAGLRVTAVDIAAAGLAGVDSVEADLEGAPWPFSGRRFDAIVVSTYLHRPLLPLLPDCLEPDGVLLYETFGEGNERFGKPSNPAFLLRPNELLEAFAGHLAIVAYECGIEMRPRAAVRQRLAAVNTGKPVRLP